MKKVIQQLFSILFILLTGVLVFSCRSTKENLSVNRENTQTVSPSTLIIHYDAKMGKEFLLEAVKSKKVEVIYDYKNFHAIAIRIPKKTKAFFEKVKGVLQVNEDNINQLN